MGRLRRHLSLRRGRDGSPCVSRVVQHLVLIGMDVVVLIVQELRGPHGVQKVLVI
jgi:hypothetical protein